MPTADELRALLARVSEATGPDREIDAELERLFLYPEMRVIAPDECFGGHGALQGKHRIRLSDPYTASLDAAVALVERVLPGAVWHVMTDYGDLRRAKIGPKGRPSASVYNVEDRPAFSEADAETPPLAMLAALLRALIAQAETGHAD